MRVFQVVVEEEHARERETSRAATDQSRSESESIVQENIRQGLAWENVFSHRVMM